MCFDLRIIDSGAIGIFSILILLIIFLIVSIFVIVIKKNKAEVQLQESLKFKDQIIKEYQKIRHDYNNMLQSFICFIEQEDLELLKTYKEEVLAKTYILNRNN